MKILRNYYIHFNCKNMFKLCKTFKELKCIEIPKYLFN